MNNRTRTIIYGLLLIALAVCLIFWKLNVFNLPQSFADVSTWGLIITAVMAVVIFHSIGDMFYAGIFFPIAVICIIFDKPLGITAITPWVVIIAATLFTIAFYMIFPKHGKYMKHFPYGNNRFSESFSESSNSDNNGHIMHIMKFGSATKYIRTPNLVSADLASQFGELSVFFDGAQVPTRQVFINCQVSFGAMNLFIPRDWRVENRVSVSLGHSNDESDNTAAANDTILCVIEGSVAFGELKISRI